MSERSYYTDSYTTQFSAVVTDAFEEDRKKYVLLDHTYFYPTSGGQPNDRGTIDAIPVIDVNARKEDGAILHTVESIPEKQEVTAVIDWNRRFDHMQQHSGQHILSQAFIQVAGAQTIGFHLSDDSVTIDLDKEDVNQIHITEAERLANEIVWQNRPIVVRWATRQEAQNLPLRKIPANGDEKLRLIDIFDFDLTACGGTHVTRTAEVGLVKVVKQEARNSKTRIHFLCGERAVDHYREINTIVSQLTAQLTTGTRELPSSVSKLQEENRQTRRMLKRVQDSLDHFEAEQLLHNGQKIGDCTIVAHVLEDDTGGRARSLATIITANDQTVALVGSTGERTHLAFSRSSDAPGSMKNLLQITLQDLNSVSGGGNDILAQGSGQSLDSSAVKNAIEKAVQQLLEEIKALG